MNYWVVRGNPAENEFSSMFGVGRADKWRTKQPPKDWQRGDRLIFWASSPQREIVALGEFRGLTREITYDDETIYRVRYDTKLIPERPTLTQLRGEPALANAVFLKLGPATSVVRLTVEEGEHIYALVCRRNPRIGRPWGRPRRIATSGSPTAAALVDLEMVVAEGTTKLVTHLARERNRKVVEAKKKAVLEAKGALACEVCDFDFGIAYGALGKGFAEVHHRLALGDGKTRATRLEDLAVVCSNCHRMLHRGDPTLGVEDLRGRIQAPRTSV